MEAVLDQHPAIRDVVVVADRDRQEEPRLVAYVVSAEGAPRVPRNCGHFCASGYQNS